MTTGFRTALRTNGCISSFDRTIDQASAEAAIRMSSFSSCISWNSAPHSCTTMATQGDAYRFVVEGYAVRSNLDALANESTHAYAAQHNTFCVTHAHLAHHRRKQDATHSSYA
jgi:hypothetical protein